MTPRSLGTATMAVLQAIAEGHRYGFDIVDRTGLASGTVYPALSSLERRRLVTAKWEEAGVARSEARPRRRYYRLTTAGQAELAEGLRRLEELGLSDAARASRRLRGAEG